MFDATWTWAGQYRSTEKNIGVAPELIATAVHHLCEDTRAQLAHCAHELDEIVARFSHRLVFIHPFANGLQHPGEARRRYLDALRSVGAGDFAPLLASVRS